MVCYEGKEVTAVVEQKQKVELTWLQCQVLRNEWNTLNERRLKLNLKWSDTIVPATKEYIRQLEASQPAEQPEEPQAKSKTKRTRKASATNTEPKAEDAATSTPVIC